MVSRFVFTRKRKPPERRKIVQIIKYTIRVYYPSVINSISLWIMETTTRCSRKIETTKNTRNQLRRVQYRVLSLFTQWQSRSRPIRLFFIIFIIACYTSISVLVKSKNMCKKPS